MPGAGATFLLRPLCWPRLRASLAALFLLAGHGAMDAARAQSAPDCQQGLMARFDRLVKYYMDSGAKAIETSEPGDALDRARQNAIKGDAGATVPIIGVQLVMRGRQDLFSVGVIRQICTFADRNGLLLHVVSCAYFAALNPLGERDQKRLIVEAQFARFEKTRESAAAGGGADAGELAGHVVALRACLPPAAL